MTLAFSIKPEISLGAGQAYLKKQMLKNRDFHSSQNNHYEFKSKKP